MNIKKILQAWRIVLSAPIESEKKEYINATILQSMIIERKGVKMYERFNTTKFLKVSNGVLSFIYGRSRGFASYK